MDFDEWTEPFLPVHYCFRVDDSEFDMILPDGHQWEMLTVSYARQAGQAGP